MDPAVFWFDEKTLSRYYTQAWTILTVTAEMMIVVKWHFVMDDEDEVSEVLMQILDLDEHLQLRAICDFDRL